MDDLIIAVCGLQRRHRAGHNLGAAAHLVRNVKTSEWAHAATFPSQPR